MKNTNWVLGIVLIVVLALLLLSGAGMMGFGGFGMMGSGMMGGYGGYGGMMSGYGFNPLGAILMFAFWSLIIGGGALGIVWLARNSGKFASSSESLLDILKTRYARGEINKEQFDAIKRDLGV